MANNGATCRWVRPQRATVIMPGAYGTRRVVDATTAALLTWKMRETVALATIDEELGALERDIRQLKIEYDQFFGGGRKRPPNEIEWRIDLIVKKYGERSGDMKFGQRFRYNNLTQTYAKYKDIFHNRLRQKEEGTVQRNFDAATKAIEV